jgi:CubicO group peptidase (beta-lactamase class C family)
MKRRTVLTQMALLSGASALKLSGKEVSSGISASRLQSAANYSARKSGKSLLVIQNGKTLFEDYPNGTNPDEMHKIYSGTKAFWCVLALAAQEDGLFDLHDRVAEFIPEWKEEDSKSRITIRQLLDFSCGLEPTFDLHEDNIPDRDAIAIKRPIVSSPGNSFIYGPCSLQVFHAILKRKLARKGELPKHYLERRVLAPLGLGPQRYVPDNSGNPLLAAGMVLTARMWASFGKMLVHEGRPLISAPTMHESCEGSSANRSFGLGLWNNSNAARSGSWEVDVELMLHEKWPKQHWAKACLCQNAPADLLASIGSGKQRLYVVPSQNLVIVRQGRESSFSDAEFLRLVFA